VYSFNPHFRGKVLKAHYRRKIVFNFSLFFVVKSYLISLQYFNDFFEVAAFAIE
jgi:hypothetical protein